MILHLPYHRGHGAPEKDSGAGAVGKWMVLPLSRVITWVTPRGDLSGVVFVTTAVASVYVSVIYAPGTMSFSGAGLALVMLAIAIIN